MLYKLFEVGNKEKKISCHEKWLILACSRLRRITPVYCGETLVCGGGANTCTVVKLILIPQMIKITQLRGCA